MSTNYQNWKVSTECEIPNTNNPNDDAGVQHNELMAKTESRGNPKMTSDEVFELADIVFERTLS